MKSLHPKLLVSLEDSPIDGFQMIHHPYLVDVMFGGSDAEIVRANALFEHKQKSISQALDNHEIAKALFLCERPYRLEFFLRHPPNKPHDYWSLLAEVYTDSEGVGKNIEVWLSLFNDCPDNKLLMNEDDLCRYHSLDDELTLYRGVEAIHSDSVSLSWTLSKKTALWFAGRFNRDGVVLSGVVKKKDVFATFFSRSESEVVIDSSLINLR